MASCRFALLLLALYCASILDCKIILPRKLRYLENMLNSEVLAKAARIRQKMEANPNAVDSEKGWPALLAKYQPDDKQSAAHTAYSYNGLFDRRVPTFK